MVFLIRSRTQLMLAEAVKCGINAESQRVKCMAVAVLNALVNFFKPYTAHAAYGVCKVFINYFFTYAYRLKYLRGLVGLNCGNTHFRGDFYNTVKYGTVIIAYCGVVILIEQFFINKLGYTFLG